MRHLLSIGICTVVLLSGIASAQPPGQPYVPPGPPTPLVSPVDGRWYFRGDPRYPCFVETITGRDGPRLLFTNEKGSEAIGFLSPDGRQVTIPSWNDSARLRGNMLIWQNGDYWSR